MVDNGTYGYPVENAEPAPRAQPDPGGRPASYASRREAFPTTGWPAQESGEHLVFVDRKNRYVAPLDVKWYQKWIKKRSFLGFHRVDAESHALSFDAEVLTASDVARFRVTITGTWRISDPASFLDYRVDDPAEQCSSCLAALVDGIVGALRPEETREAQRQLREEIQGAAYPAGHGLEISATRVVVRPPRDFEEAQSRIEQTHINRVADQVQHDRTNQERLNDLGYAWTVDNASGTDRRQVSEGWLRGVTDNQRSPEGLPPGTFQRRVERRPSELGRGGNGLPPLEITPGDSGRSGRGKREQSQQEALTPPENEDPYSGY